MNANRRRHLQIPFPRVVVLECGVGENTSGTDLDQVARELVFENSVFAAAEEYGVPHAERVQVVSSGVFAIEANAAVALDAAVHLVVHETARGTDCGTCACRSVAAVAMASHHRHVLQMALAAFVAHRTIVRVVQHHPLDDARAEMPRLPDREWRSASFRCAASCTPSPVCRAVSFSSLNCLTAHWRHAPTEPSAGCQQKYGRSKPSERQAWSRFCFGVRFVRFAVDVDGCHAHLQGQRLFIECAARNRRGNISVRFAMARRRPARVRRTCCPGARNLV